MVGEQPVEERRVAVLERGEADVLLERVGLDPQVFELELDLLLDRQDAGREEATQPERLALLDREREILGEQAAAEEGRAGDRDARRTPGHHVVERGRQRLHGPSMVRVMEPLPPGFRWPDGIRAAALFGFDLDAEAVMLVDHPETADYLDVMAHQRYGPRVAVPRLLRMLDRVKLRTTFFIPGWVAETWPDVARSVRDAGHEIGHHGYLHESVRGVDAATEEGYLLRGLEALDTVLGVRPIGYRPPSWDMNFETPALLAKHGFRYDSALMDSDHPYRLAAGAAGRRRGARRPRPSSSSPSTGASTTGTAGTTSRATRPRRSCARASSRPTGPRSSRRSSRSAASSTSRCIPSSRAGRPAPPPSSA